MHEDYRPYKTDINGRGDSLRWPRDTPLPAKVRIHFADKWRPSVGAVRLMTSGHGVCLLLFSLDYKLGMNKLNHTPTTWGFKVEEKCIWGYANNTELNTIALEQWSSTWGTRTLGGTGKHITWYVKTGGDIYINYIIIICIYIILDVINLMYFRCRLQTVYTLNCTPTTLGYRKKSCIPFYWGGWRSWNRGFRGASRYVHFRTAYIPSITDPLLLLPCEEPFTEIQSPSILRPSR
jgi:hypothetical protein